ncbi:ABC transporter ATP-binding protein [Candidatus Poribacteria bacterium]|nr:ABC transporter ATP-binding protein [Candidatus Poribacteria bacterium]MXY28268.1 ABC transporter ATP-binding protein [Candidatus Poribacteria bacterium]MYK16592.1 ABC transporter ATP-binding protein [Candidatus Poribacteria bacterium]
MSKLEVRNLTQSFVQKDTRLQVLDTLNFSVDEGQFVALLGPSGCGKSTLFNIISGLLVPDTGEIYLNGKRIYGNTGDFAYMQQKDLLLPWRTVLRNVLIGPEIHNELLDTAREEAQKRLAQLGLSGFENSYPMQLSGGMRQRVALVRTLLFRKKVLLLDEPFGALDAMTRTVMQSILLDIWAEDRQTVLLITHDIEEALLLADKIYVLTARPATLKAEVPVSLSRPRDITDTALIRLKRELLSLLQIEISAVFDAG